MGLGIVLTPYGKLPNGAPPYAIDYAYKGATSWFGSNSAGDAPNVANTDPHQDPQFLARGEQGYYYDTPLGRPSGMRGVGNLRGLGRALGSVSTNAILGLTALSAILGGAFGSQVVKGSKKKRVAATIGFGLLGGALAIAARRLAMMTPVSSAGVSGYPTDFDIAMKRQYLPFESGWIPLKDNKILATGPWIPPGEPGWLNPRFPQPVISATPNELGGFGRLRDAAPPIVPTPGSSTNVDDVVGVMTAHNDRAFSLALVSTTAVAVSALLGVFRTLKLIREDSSRD